MRAKQARPQSCATLCSPASSRGSRRASGGARRFVPRACPLLPLGSMNSRMDADNRNRPDVRASTDRNCRTRKSRPCQSIRSVAAPARGRKSVAKVWMCNHTKICLSLQIVVPGRYLNSNSLFSPCSFSSFFAISSKAFASSAVCPSLLSERNDDSVLTLCNEDSSKCI